MEQLYTPRKGPMNVVVFFSGGASGLKAMLEDPNYGNLYRVTGAYTDREDDKNSKGIALCRDHDIKPVIFRREEFYSRHRLDNSLNSRIQFYQAVLHEIDGFSADVICLSGYMHVVSNPVLSEHKNRTLNVHPASLSILFGPNCQRLDASELSSRDVRDLHESHRFKRKFKGENTVYKAIIAGEQTLRSTVHIATERFDDGPIIAQSKPFDVDPEIIHRVSQGLLDGVKEYASTLQDRMKTDGDGPAYLKALEFVSQGRLSILDQTLILDDGELPYGGHRLN